MLKAAKQIFYLFDKKEKYFITFMFVLMLIGTFFEALGMGAIVPFVTLLSRPDFVKTNAFFGELYNRTGAKNINEFLIILSASLMGLYVVKNAYLFAVVYIQSYFCNKKNLKLSSELFQLYLYSPYTFHLQRNTVELMRNLNLIMPIMSGVLYRMLDLITDVVVIIVIIVCLICVHPVSSVAIISIMAVSMGLFHLFIRKRMKIYGQMYSEYLNKTSKQMHQGLGSIKETKIFKREQFFDLQYSSHQKQLVKTLHWQKVITEIPRYYIETVTMIMVMGVMIYFLRRGDNPQVVLFTLSFFCVAAVRMMPSIYRMGSCMTSIRFYLPSLDTVYNELLIVRSEEERVTRCGNEGAITFADKITVEDMTYSYGNNSKFLLNKISLEINKNNTVGFAGSSGAGKTTLVDLLIGLMMPNSGRILVDGKDIQTNVSSWQRQIGYIPQTIYLMDGSIRDNIAFGLFDEDIDDEKVRRAIKLSQLEDFINSLPDGMNTMVGERGIRLSGGQKQRIGIARALYYDPGVLVMDEATAALDNETERAFMEAVKTLSGAKTILIIAHRLTTIEHCDVIFFINNGTLVAKGKYHELLEKSPDFRKMAGREV